MKSWLRNPLKAQWLIVTMGLLLLGLALVIGLYERRGRVLETERQRFAKMADIVELNLTGRAYQTDKVLLTLREMVPGEKPELWDSPEIAQQLARLIPFIGNLADISLIDAQGRIRHSTDASLLGGDFSAETIFRQFRADAAGADNFRYDYLIRPDGVGNVAVARPIFSSGKRFAGIVMCSLSLDFVRRLLDSTRYADDMRVSMASIDGRVMVVTPRLVGIEGKNVAVPGSHFSTHIASSQPTSFYLGKTLAVGDMPRIGMIRSVAIPNTPGPQLTIVSMTRNPDEVLAAWRQDVKIVAGMYLLFGLTAVVSFTYFYRRQTAAAAELECSRIAHSAELERQAYFDALTGVPNRRLMIDRLQRAIEHSRRQGKLLALCYLDLDGFKPVNDRLGHEAGDLVLVATARRLEAAVRSGDTVARIGGDEFVLLLSDMRDVQECELVLNRILAAIEEPIPLTGSVGHVSASIGVALFPGDGADADTLLRNSDEAMYAAKRSGKRCRKFFASIGDAQAPAGNVDASESHLLPVGNRD